MHTKFETHGVSPKAAYPFPPTHSLAVGEASSVSGPATAPQGKRLSRQRPGPIAAQSPTNSFDQFQRYRPSKSSPLASPTLEAVESAERSSGAQSEHSLTRTLTRDGSNMASPPSPRSGGSLTRPRLYQQVSESNPQGRLVLVRSISPRDISTPERPRAPTPERASRIFESILDAEPREESGAGIRPPKLEGFFQRLWRKLLKRP